MRKVQIWVELSDEKYHAYFAESRRLGVTVETLVEGMIGNLMVEVEQEARDGTDHPVFLE